MGGGRRRAAGVMAGGEASGGERGCQNGSAGDTAWAEGSGVGRREWRAEEWGDVFVGWLCFEKNGKMFQVGGVMYLLNKKCVLSTKKKAPAAMWRA